MKKEITKYSRQGDVYLKLRKDSEVPDGLQWQEVKEVTLAHGEKTGHRHTVVAEGLGASLWIARGFDEKTYVKVTRGARGYHQEHDPVGYELPEGIHEQVQEIEYDYLSKKNRKARD